MEQDYHDLAVLILKLLVLMPILNSSGFISLSTNLRLSQCLIDSKQWLNCNMTFPLKVVQSDWGREFRPFTKFLNDLRIIHRLVCPHTHHQNGVVERKHRHSGHWPYPIEQASLPLTYWDFPFSTTVFLINRLPTSSIYLQVPYTLLFNQQPNYKFLKVFRCACFPLLNIIMPTSLILGIKKSLFLGYSTSHKGSRCLSPSGKLYIFKDVFFNEARFPYPDLFLKPTTYNLMRKVSLFHLLVLVPSSILSHLTLLSPLLITLVLNLVVSLLQ